MRPTQFGGARVVGVVAVALLLGAMLAPVVSAQSGYAGVVGRWAGYVTWPGGASGETTWTINPDGTFSIQTSEYTAVGSLQSRGSDYAFSYERNGQTYAGTLAVRPSNGRSRLVGRGETPNGPMDITLTR